MDGIGQGVASYYAFRGISEFTGELMLFGGVILMIVYVWKHAARTGTNAGYHFSLRYLNDWVVCLVVLTLLGFGGWLTYLRVTAPVVQECECVLF